MQLFQLQLTVFSRPFIGGIGFLLVVPAIGFAIEPTAISNPQLAFLVSLLPETKSLSIVLALFFCVMLLNAAARVAFANPVRRDGLLDNVLRYVLVGAQETNNVHGQIVAIEIHHRYVEVHPNPRVLVEIEGQVLDYSRVQKRLRFHE